MDKNLHTPKGGNTSGGHSSLGQFWQSLIATTISIVLTFGTAAVIDHYKKEAAKKEMVMMIIYDFDQTIKNVEKNDTAFNDAMHYQAELAAHPEHLDSLRFKFVPAIMIMTTSFSETTEKIFSSNIETFNTISNVNFISEVSNFYDARQSYNKQILDNFKKDIEGKDVTGSLGSLFSVNFPEYLLLNRSFLDDMRESRNKCMKMMDVSEEDIIAFSTQNNNLEDNTHSADYDSNLIQEVDSLEMILGEAQNKYHN